MAAWLHGCMAARLSELELLRTCALLVQLSFDSQAAAAAAELPELHFPFCHGCIAVPAQVAMLLPLQLKSCIAELMAQSKFNI